MQVKCLAWLVNVMEGEKAIEGGESQRTGGEAYLEIMFYARMESILTEKRMLGMWKATALRDIHPMKSTVQEGYRSFSNRDFIQGPEGSLLKD